ncbi:MAG: hypothetical protein LBR84_04290 [Tannerella sp.]|jgi:hypothetical protein|nr:hypothetical protein [Tannerella sp.]
MKQFFFSTTLLLLIFISHASGQKSERWIASVRGGGSYLLGNHDKTIENNMLNGASREQAEKYVNDYITGWHGSADVYYMIFNFFGFGVKYSAFTTSGNLKMMQQVESDIGMVNFQTGMNEKAYTQFVASSLIFRQKLGQKFAIAWKSSVGYVRWRSEIYADKYHIPYNLSEYPNMLLEANTWGISEDASVEYFPVSRISIGLNIGYLFSLINKATLSTKYNSPQSLDMGKDAQSLARLDYSLGLGFYF